MSVTVRPARLEDAAALAEANVRSIREVCSRDYPDPAHLDAWCANKTAESFERWLADPEQRLFAGLLDDRIVGVGNMHLPKGWIYILYLVPEALGTGLGKALLAAMEAEAKAHGHRTIGLESTVTARGFYRAQGYQELGETTVCGLPAYRMEKALG